MATPSNAVCDSEITDSSGNITISNKIATSFNDEQRQTVRRLILLPGVLVIAFYLGAMMFALGTYLAYASDHLDTPTVIADPAADKGQKRRFRVFAGLRDEPGLWQMPVEGGAESVVLDNLNPVDRDNWLVSAEAIYFVSRPTPETPTLTRFDLASRKTTPLTKLERFFYRSGLALSPGKNLAALCAH